MSAVGGETFGSAFSDSAARHGERVAIETGAGAVGYAELDRRVEAISSAILSLALASPRHVGVLFDPGADAVAAILGVLRAGHVVVPLDARDPVDRLRFVLDDGAIGAIVTNDEHLAFAQDLAHGGCAVLDIGVVRSAPVDAVRPDVSPDDAAYLMYTSGSTGRPKGVIQTHRGLLHFVQSYSARLGICPDDRVSLLFSLGFSASSMDIHGALLSGATLCPLDLRSQGVNGLAGWIEERRISVLHGVPTLVRHLARTAPAIASLDSVRLVDLGGEPVHPRDLSLCRSRFAPRCAIINHLAATEASVMAQHELTAGDDDRDGIVPVGVAAPGVEITVVGEDGVPVPAGEPGEIVVHSRFLSPGYWQRPELTAVAFADDPRGDGWRSYRTGDLGRRDAAGVVSVLGRADGRLKIRGHSVYVAEVEAALLSLGSVREVVVVGVAPDGSSQERPPPAAPTLGGRGRPPVRGEPDAPRPRDPDLHPRRTAGNSQDAAATASRRLVAYVVAEVQDGRELRRRLALHVPEYMLPAEVIVLDALPVTATGKVDRRALSGSGRPRSVVEPEVPPPRGPTERTVAAIYSRVLRVESVGRDDGFFDLGGDSIAVAQLQVELEAELGLAVPLSALLRDATVAGVAAAVDGAKAEVPSLLVPLRESGARPILFLVHGLLGQAFVSPGFVSALGDDQPAYAIQARGLDGSETPHDRIPAMAADYIAAIRRVQPEGPYYVGGICAGSIVAHEIACQLRDAGETVGPLLLIDPPLPHIERGWSERLRERVRLQIARLPFGTRVRSRLRREVVHHAERLRARRDPCAPEPAPLDRTQREALTSVAVAFRVALDRHRPRPFEGRGHVLASRDRLTHDVWTSGAWRRHLPGDVELIDVGASHGDVLDPANERFAAALRRCVAEARAAFQAGLDPRAPCRPARSRRDRA